MDAAETDDVSLVGDECHIVAEKPGGARGDATVPREQLEKYDNLILLCKIHHKLIDDLPGEYTIERLKTMKREHESWVTHSLASYDSLKQRDDETYAAIVDSWQTTAHLAEWKAWTSFVFGADQPSIASVVDADLRSLQEWLFTRVWPHRYPVLESGFTNFRRVLSDFLKVFHLHAEAAADEFYTKKFYHIDEWNPARYEALFRQYIFHVRLVEDLLLELTRSANYICDIARTFVDPTFRSHEGALIVGSGPYEDMSWRLHRVEYRGEERTDAPYPGLDQFKRIRKTRDLHFGVGTDTSDPEFEEWYQENG